jgi:hypothetical protein
MPLRPIGELLLHLHQEDANGKLADQSCMRKGNWSSS